MILEMIMDREKLDSLKVFWASAEERRGEGAGGGAGGRVVRIQEFAF